MTNLLSFYERALDVVQERDRWADRLCLWLKKRQLRNGEGPGETITDWMKDYLMRREMKTVVMEIWLDISEKRSSPCRVQSWHQLFLAYINEMSEGMNNYMSLFAVIAKLIRSDTSLTPHAQQDNLRAAIETSFTMIGGHIEERGATKSSYMTSWYCQATH